MIEKFRKKIAAHQRRTRKCPACDGEIAAQHLNIAEGVALCPACGHLTRLDELLELNETVGTVVPGEPPTGCHFSGWQGDMRLTTSAQSFGGIVGTFCIMLFWNGMLSIFVLLAFAGLYINVVGPLPAWFPAPTMSNNGQPMSLGMAIFLWLFLTPFILAGFGLTLAFLFKLAGSVIVTLQGDQAIVRTGVGPFRWRKRFTISKVTGVKIGPAGWSQNEEPQSAVVIEAADRVRFGSMLPEGRKRWLCESLRVLLLFPESARAKQLLDQVQNQPHWPN